MLPTCRMHSLTRSVLIYRHTANISIISGEAKQNKPTKKHFTRRDVCNVKEEVRPFPLQGFYILGDNLKKKIIWSLAGSEMM